MQVAKLLRKALRADICMPDCLADGQIFANHARAVLQADEYCVTPATTIVVMHAMQRAVDHCRLEGKLNALKQPSQEL